jgi:hypothetical protein
LRGGAVPGHDEPPGDDLHGQLDHVGAERKPGDGEQHVELRRADGVGECECDRVGESQRVDVDEYECREQSAERFGDQQHDGSDFSHVDQGIATAHDQFAEAAVQVGIADSDAVDLVADGYSYSYLVVDISNGYADRYQYWVIVPQLIILFEA